MNLAERGTPPGAGTVRPFEFPDVHERALAGGMELRVARLPRLPVVTAVIVMPVGEGELDDSRAGLALLAGESLDGGTRGRSAGELALALESIGATLQLSVGWDATTASLSCLAERLPEALALLAEVVREPGHPASEVERTRDQLLARIRQRSMDPGALAGDWTARLLYADGVPYGRPLGGTVASVSALGAPEASEFARSWYRPAGAAVVLAGDVDPNEGAALVERSFAGWSGRPPARAAALDTPRQRRRTLHLVHRPGAVQSEVRVGHPGVPRGHEDHYALVIANTVLGGAFTSRLNLSLRERHGFTYGVRSRFSMRRGAGPFLVSTAVESDVTAGAVREVLAELEAFAAHGPSEEEVEAARDYVAGVFPLSMETTGQVAGRIAELLVYDLPADYHARYRDRIRAVDTEQARAAAARHVRAREATVVVVGDAERVREPLEALAAGPLEVHGSEP